MAEKIERTYTIPLRREYLKVPRYRRTEKASRALRSFLVKHMKSDMVNIGKHLNEFLWMHGMKNPPHHVKVNVVKTEGKVYAELFGKQLKIGKEEKVEKKDAVPKKEEKKENIVDAVVKEEKIAEKKEKKTDSKRG